MSRIGKKPVQIPAGVTVEIEGTTVTVKGSKGELNRSFSELIKFEQEGEEINVIRVDESTESNAQQGLSRTLLQGTGRPGCRRDPHEAPARALQGQGHPLRG